MPRIVSLKALIFSNIAHWLLLGLGMILVIALYYAGATIASEGTSSAATILEQMKSSSVLIGVLVSVAAIAPIPAGYIAAKIAPRAKLLHGVLSTSAFLIFSVYDAIWGANSEAQISHWYDLLTSYGAPISALVGAYIWQIRASRHTLTPVDAAAPTETQRQPEMAATLDGSKQIQARRIAGAGTGLGLFIFIISNILLTSQERDMLFIAVVTLVAFLVLAVWASKVLKNLRP